MPVLSVLCAINNIARLPHVGSSCGGVTERTNQTEEMLRTTVDKERGGKKEISSVVIKMKNGPPATLNKS